MAEAQQPVPTARKVVLRLDDGSVIAAAETLGVADASTPAVALDPDKAFAAGRLAPEAVTKLEELLRTFADKFPSRHLRTVDLKRRASDAFGEEDGGGLRQRSTVLATPRANGHTSVDDGSPTSAGGGGGSWHRGEFEDICLDILLKLWPMFGKSIIYFDHPVEISVVPDYYNVIKRENARDLGSLKTKLLRRKYSSPQGFYDDMHLFFHNIVVYNGAASDFGKLSNKVEKAFEDQWAASGLAGSTRARRATAGMARPKYEPAPPEKKPLARSGSARSGGRAQQPRAAPPRTQSAAARPPPSRPDMTRDRMQTLAQTLSSLDGPVLDGVLQIIREGTNLPADGEIELDFDSLSHDILWQLDDYLQKQNMVPADNSFKVEAESESEEEESESDSAD